MKLISRMTPKTQGAHEAFRIQATVDIALLIAFFGRQHTNDFLREVERTGNSYLNRLGANCHYICHGGAVDDPLITLAISGHHAGEAAETFNALADTLESVL